MILKFKGCHRHEPFLRIMTAINNEVRTMMSEIDADIDDTQNRLMTEVNRFKDDDENASIKEVCDTSCTLKDLETRKKNINNALLCFNENALSYNYDDSCIALANELGILTRICMDNWIPYKTYTTELEVCDNYKKKRGIISNEAEIL